MIFAFNTIYDVLDLFSRSTFVGNFLNFLALHCQAFMTISNASADIHMRFPSNSSSMYLASGLKCFCVLAKCIWELGRRLSIPVSKFELCHLYITHPFWLQQRPTFGEQRKNWHAEILSMHIRNRASHYWIQLDKWSCSLDFPKHKSAHFRSILYNVQPSVCNDLCAGSWAWRAVCNAHYDLRRFDLGYMDASDSGRRIIFRHFSWFEAIFNSP